MKKKQITRTPRLSYSLSLMLVAVPVLIPVFCFESVAFAQAGHPLVRTALAIKNVKLSMPIPFEDVDENGVTGLSAEDKATAKQALALAADYAEYRTARGSEKRRLWARKCEKAEAAQSTDVETEQLLALCTFEAERMAPTSRIKSKGPSRAERSLLTDAIKHQRFEELAESSSTDISRTINRMGSAAKPLEVAKNVSQSKACVPSSVSAGLGYKLEELFPEPAVVDVSKELYKKASTCGNDLASAQGAFRLGLILVWQNQCGEVPELMKKAISVSEATQYHARAKYWQHYCLSRSTETMAAGSSRSARSAASKLLKENVASKDAAKASLLSSHPLTFQNLAVSGSDDNAVASFIKADTPKISLRSLIRPDLNALLRMVEALMEIGAKDLAAEMLDRNIEEIKSLEPEVRLYTALLLNKSGFALAKFKILSALFDGSPKMISAKTLRLYFPLWYMNVVTAKQAEGFNHIDPLLILALIRQESAFNQNARSIVGARGLMQVMPATARTIASVPAKRLYDPATNIGIGTKYFAKRLHQLDGNVELTLAAYNAGIGRIVEWQKRYPTDNKMLFLDFIPFRETRDYVSFILRNYYFYVKLYGQESRSSASIEGIKPDSIEPKITAIINANAGAAMKTNAQ